MRWLFVAVFTVTAAPAAAQLPFVNAGGVMNPTISSPDPSRYNCGTGSDCHPLNAAQCADQSDTTGMNRTIHISLPPATGWSATTSLVSGVSQLIVWVQQAGTAPTSDQARPSCQLPTGAAPSSEVYPIIATHTLIQTQWPFTGGNILFPDALNDGTLGTSGDIELTMGDLINATGKLSTGTQVKNACDATNPVDITYYVLCFGIDTLGATGTQPVADGGITPTTEPTGWVIFTVDTKPPAEVTKVEWDPLPEAITVTPTAARTSAGDRWNVKLRELPADQAPSTEKCSDWKNVSKSMTVDAIKEKSVTIAVVNNTVYELCVDLLDELGNEGTAADTLTVSTFDQCDWASCYPGDQHLKTGFCAAAAPAPFAAAALSLLLRRLRRRRGVRS